MIKASELRIGNFVYYDGNICHIELISEDEAKAGSYCHPEHLSPILLTPDILQKAGFVLDTKVWWSFPSNILEDWRLLDYSPSEESFGLTIDRVVMGTEPLKYLHQLQNLYFALTGEELQIKL